jgi:hypothetical protein
MYQEAAQKLSEGIGEFHFGLSWAQINNKLSPPFGDSGYESLPVAGEFAPVEVRYIGNWAAKIGPIDGSDAEDGPWVEFWQVQAVATLDRQAFADRITPFGTISEGDARQLAHLLCSEPRIVPRSGVFSGFWRGFEPTHMPGIYK